MEIGFILDGHKFEYEIKHLIKAFYPYEDVKSVSKLNDTKIVIKSIKSNDKLSAEIYESGILKLTSFDKISNNICDERCYKKEVKRILKALIYTVLVKYTDKELPWGILTGIRPTKIVTSMVKQNKTNIEIEKCLKEKYLINDDKIKLMLDIKDVENNIINENNNNEISIYIGIPFCPTRCLYCSFTSYPIDKYKDLVEDYLVALNKEIQEVSRLVKGKKIRSIYIGGGTPTSLNANQLKKLMLSINNNFSLKEIDEFTVEAGRPDTITQEKLQVLKTFNVDRISINPQTMNDKTLKVIGRHHTVQEIIDKYSLAQEIGFNNINMDFIVGLPNETVEDVRYSMDKVKELSPQSITVHTMAIKRASRLRLHQEDYTFTSSEDVEKMIDIAKKTSEELGMRPYYMYRQKNMIGNFENVGYALPNKECIYNIEIIEEKETIMALGAGSVTKVVFPEENRIERIENVKNVNDYIKRIDEMINRKKTFFDSLLDK